MGPVLYWATSSIRFLYLSGSSSSLSIGWKISFFSFCSCSFEATWHVWQRPLCLYCLGPWAIELIPAKLLNFLGVRICLPLTIAAKTERNVFNIVLVFSPVAVMKYSDSSNFRKTELDLALSWKRWFIMVGSSRQQLLEATGCITSTIRKQRNECTLVLSMLYVVQDALPRE